MLFYELFPAFVMVVSLIVAIALFVTNRGAPEDSSLPSMSIHGRRLQLDGATRARERDRACAADASYWGFRLSSMAA